MQDSNSAAGNAVPWNGEWANDFVSDVAQIRRRARQHIQNSALSSERAADGDTVLRLLNEALATELACVWRYRRHHQLAGVVVAEAVKEELQQHANEEQGHADQLARRILELGGTPDLSPAGPPLDLPSDYLEGDTLPELLAEDLIAERIAIESYREIVQYLSDRDPATCRLFESILAVEEEHAAGLRSMREEMLRTVRRAALADSSAQTVEIS